MSSRRPATPPLQIQITPNDLWSIELTNYWEPDEIFLVLNGNPHPFPRSLLEYCSPTFRRLRSIDSTIDSFILHKVDQSGAFCDFLALAQGSATITVTNWKLFADVFSQLGDREHCEQVLTHFEGDISIHNSIDRLNNRSRLGVVLASDISFIASNFYKFSTEAFDDVDFDLLYDIISHPSLKVDGEDALYTFIIEKFKVDERCQSLLQFVRFELLSRGSLSSFVE
jgi:hypothetical protein